MSEEPTKPKSVRITIESDAGTMTYEMENWTYKSTSYTVSSFRDIQIHAWAGLHAKPCSWCGRRDLPEHGHLSRYEVRFYPGGTPNSAPFGSAVRVCAADPGEAANCATGLVDTRAIVELIRGKDPPRFARPGRCLARAEDRWRSPVPTWVVMMTHGREGLIALDHVDPMNPDEPTA